MSGLRIFIREIHHRSLWQVLLSFLMFSAVSIEIADVLTDRVGLPDWTTAMVIVVLSIGLPIVVATAYIQGGFRRGEAQSPAVLADSPEPATGIPVDTPMVDSTQQQRDPGISSAVSTRSRSKWGGLFTWKNVLLGTLGSFTLLGFSIFGYFVLWSSGIGPMGNLVAQGVFEEGEMILLSSFEDQTESGLGDVVTEALRVDLQESAVVNLLAPSAISDAMARMGRPADAVFSADAAQELSVRDGYKAYVQGEIAAVGGGYLLTAALVAGESGDILKAFRVPVDSEDELLQGIDKLSQDIREKSGESLATIKRGVSLAQATTSSLEALRMYSEANIVFEESPLSALPLLEEAVELDPDFAMAWRKIAVILANNGLDPDRVRDAATRAFDLRRRLTAREAGLAEAYFRSNVEDDQEGAINAYYRLLDRYPDEWVAMNNAGVRLLRLGRYTEALEILSRACCDRPEASQNVFSNLIQAQWNMGQREEAWASLEELNVKKPEASTRFRIEASLLAGERRWTEAYDVFDQDVALNPGSLVAQIRGVTNMAGSLLGNGRYAQALSVIERAKRTATAERANDFYVTFPGSLRFDVAYALEGSEEEARNILEGIERDINLDSLSSRSGAWSNLMLSHALIGNSARADEMFRTYESDVPPEERGLQYRINSVSLEAFGAFGRKDYPAAASAFDVLGGEVVSCGSVCRDHALWGIALETAGRMEEAVIQYEAHLSGGPLNWNARRTPWTPTVMERLSGLYADQGDVERAVEILESLVAQYSDGDGPFLPYVNRAQRRLGELRE